jgi:hypothetical protein
MAEGTPNPVAVVTHAKLLAEALEAAKLLTTSIQKLEADSALHDSLKTDVKKSSKKAGEVVDAITKATNMPPVVSITYRQEDADDKTVAANNACYWVGGLALLAGVLSYLNPVFVQNYGVKYQWDVWFLVSIGLVPVILIDVFLGWLLSAVIRRGSSELEQRPYIPNKGPALFLLVFIYFSFMLLFANVNLTLKLVPYDAALYKAALTVMTFEHSAYEPKTGGLQLLIGFELFSVIFLFFVFFPLLIARLALFYKETTSVRELKEVLGLKKVNDLANAIVAKLTVFTLKADSEVKWEKNGIATSPETNGSLVFATISEFEGQVEVNILNKAPQNLTAPTPDSKSG